MTRISEFRRGLSYIELMALNPCEKHPTAQRFARLLALALAAFAYTSPAAVTSPQAPAPDQFAQSFARGVRLQQAGDFQGAEEAYESALKLNPRSVEALGNLGTVLVRQGKFQPAIESYARALAINSKLEAVRFQLAFAYFRTNQFDAARKELVAVVTRQPANHKARHLLGLALLKLNQPFEGIAELEQVLRADPGDQQASYTLASAYITTGQVEKAEPIAERLRDDPSGEARYIVGSVYVAKSLHSQAISELTRALELNPKLPGVRTQLAYACLFKGRREEAIKLFEGEMALNPEDMNAVAFLGWLYRQDGRLEEADSLLVKARQLRPNDPDVLFQLGLLAESKRQYDEAIQLFNHVADAKPDHVPVHIALVRVYFRLKRMDDVKREQAIVDRLNAERKNQPTVKDKVLYEVITKPLEQRD